MSLQEKWEEIAEEIGASLGGEITPEVMGPYFEKHDLDGDLAQQLPEIEAKIREWVEGIAEDRVRFVRTAGLPPMN